jgi:soluble lytic murein transglycosylase-like protein
MRPARAAFLERRPLSRASWTAPRATPYTNGSPLPRVASSSSARSGLGLLGLSTAALALTLAGPSQADIYKTVAPDGVISFTNSPKKGGKLYARTEAPAPKVHMPSDSSPGRRDRYDEHIRQAAALYQIPEELIRAVIKVESDFDPRAVSPANARGLMQLIPETADRMLVTDVFDPRQNIYGGVRYLRILANLFNGDIELTLAGYNAGENAVIRHGGIPPYPETVDYVKRVLGYYREYRSAR